MITSVQNIKVKRWRKLQKRREREKAGAFLVEGYHLLEEAKQSGATILEIIVEQNKEIPEQCNDAIITVVNKSVFSHISQTEAPQGIAAVVAMGPSIDVMGNYVLLIDAVQDPGNLGTIIRTADAAGFDAVVLGEGTVDLYNDKVIRATQGSLFHVPVLRANLVETVDRLKTVGFHIWATALDQAKIYNQVEVTEKTALIVGNEGAGVHSKILEAADTIVKLPIQGKAESLNVSVAAGILMYYIRR